MNLLLQQKFTFHTRANFVEFFVIQFQNLMKKNNYEFSDNNHNLLEILCFIRKFPVQYTLVQNGIFNKKNSTTLHPSVSQEVESILLFLK